MPRMTWSFSDRDAAGSCRRLGYFATFMVPARAQGPLRQRLASARVGGWIRRPGAICFMPVQGNGHFSGNRASHYLGGLLAHAVAATVFATPTVNGYRRFRRIRSHRIGVGWGYDHRGSDGPRPRRRRRSRDPARESDWRAGGESVPVHCVADRAGSTGSSASSIPGPRRRCLHCPAHRCCQPG